MTTKKGYADSSQNSIDFVQHEMDGCGQPSMRSLFVEQILEVSFSKGGQRLYRVQWESTWETEEHLLSICKDVLRKYWEKQTQYNIILDKDVFPENNIHGTKKRKIRRESNSLEDQDIDIDSSLSSQVETTVSSQNDGIEARCKDEGKITDIPEQYKNVGFAKSVRENFGKVVPCENKFDFVEHYLAEKLVVKPRNIVKRVKKKPEDNVKSYISYRNGTRVHCDVCSASFADQKSLASHKICQHDQFSPHQCHICLKMFAKPGDIRRHLTAHSPTRSYYCHFCQKTYKTKNHLHRHIKAKHNDSKFPGNDILAQALVSDSCDGNDFTETVVVNLTQNHGNDMQYADNNRLTDDYSGDDLNSLVFTDNAVFFQNTLHSGVVLQQPVLTDSFLTAAPDGKSLIDKRDNFFNCTSFIEGNSLLEP